MPAPFRRIPLFAFTVLLLISVRFHYVHASLEKLRQYQRKCWRDIGRCIMFMDGDRAYGCAQCGQDTRTAILREFKSVAPLLRFLNPDIDSRVLLLPEYVFFSPEVLRTLETATNVAAVIVYESTQDANNETLDYPPIFGNQLSTDLLEPNEPYNYYHNTSISSEGASPTPTPLNRNFVGKGTKFLLYPFNIFHVNATTADILRERIARFPTVDSLIAVQEEVPKTSATAPRYKAQSRGQMYACPTDAAQASNPGEGSSADDDTGTTTTFADKADSKKCLKAETCLPIGGQSLWSALERVDKASPPNGGILAITAPMDSLAFFPDLALGASAEIASVAVLMTVVKLVSDFRRSSEGRGLQMMMQPVYFLWNAESWGYTGSARFLKDVENFNCTERGNAKDFKSGCTNPFMNSLKFEDFKDAKFTVLNIGQITSPVFEETQDDNPERMHLFYMQSFKENDQQEKGKLEEALSNVFGDSGDLKLSEGLRDAIPIDSSQSFRIYKPEAEVISVTNYKTTFNNTLYHSIYDNETLITDRKPIRRLAAAIAKVVISLAFGKEDAQLEEDEVEETINQLLTCMTSHNQWINCSEAKKLFGNDAFEVYSKDVKPGNYPGSFFPSTRTDANPAASAKLRFLRSFLAYYNRYDEEKGKKNPCSITDDNSCKDFIEEINKRAESQTHSELRTGFCTMEKCVASDTYTHNAFGPALSNRNPDQTMFEYKDEEESDDRQSDSSTPQGEVREAGWTESVWDFELGFCGFVEDTSVFGGVILGLGIFVMILSLLTVYCFDLQLRKSDKDPGAVSIAATSAGWPTDQNA